MAKGIGASSKASHRGYVRVLDDSGEDYLYPERYFLPIPVPTQVREVISEFAAAG